MKVVYHEGSRKTLDEADDEVREAVAAAIKQIENKRGFKTIHEVWRECNLIITIGHNIYTTSIHIVPTDEEMKRKSKSIFGKRWHNGHAYFCNSVFWSNFNKIPVELI